MSIFTILETIFIGPLKLLFEIIYSISLRSTGDAGLAIVALSLAMNILALPLYMQADALQEKARDVENKLRIGVEHIKKTFSGDEKMMILQTYYRQNNYSPLSSLNGSISLLLEIPFFMAAYQFLSHLDILQGVSFGIIRDLAAPDALISIGDLTINVLPILMTLINIIAGNIYLKGFPLKDKLQLYGMAGLFLIFLYNSPACLVFYWTLNNIFSLFKNIFLKLENPKKVLLYILFGTSIVLFVCRNFFHDDWNSKQRSFALTISIILQLPVLMNFITIPEKVLPKGIFDRKIFRTAIVFMTVFIGIYIPSVYIAASPQEYVDLNHFYHPLLYIGFTLCMAIGTFIVWMQVFYEISNDRAKIFFDKAVVFCSGAALVNYMFFGTNLGVISSVLQYENKFNFSKQERIINILVLIIVAVLTYFLLRKYKTFIVSLLSASIISFLIISGINISTIDNSIEKLKNFPVDFYNSRPYFNLSQKGNNVVVIFLDRGMGQYVPYIFNEKPELKEKFAGFTYYQNTISYGGCTNISTPSLMGGYEYTPVELNKRDKEKLVDKHNESAKVIPVLFDSYGYEVTVCDVPYANYQWISDLSIYNNYPNIRKYNTVGNFAATEDKESIIEMRKRNFSCFSFMKTVPVVIQKKIYDDGHYNQVRIISHSQVAENIHKAKGTNSAFLANYQVLKNLKNLTNIVSNSKNTYVFLQNSATHEPCMLQTPNYEPMPYVENTEYDLHHTRRFNVNNKIINIKTSEQMASYHVNIAALLRIGEWLDYLKDNNVYDNTRIIIVSDHGSGVGTMDELMAEDINIECYYPLFMMKDFNSQEFTISNEFMTVADTPILSVKDIIEKPINPFTGREINNDEKFAHEQFVSMSSAWETSKNNGNTFIPSKWASVKKNIWMKDNWKVYKKDMVLKEYFIP